MVYHTGEEELIFFDKFPTAFPLYEAFVKELFEMFPLTSMKVQKSQITFSNRHVFACVSFSRVKKKAELPDPYIVITLGLSYPLESDRVAVKTEPYPGRWTTHLDISSQSELDNEFLCGSSRHTIFQKASRFLFFRKLNQEKSSILRND